MYMRIWTHVEVLRKYIGDQEEDHRKTSFTKEVQRLLECNEVAYDPKYLDGAATNETH